MLLCPDASALLAWLIRDQSSPSVSQFWGGLTSADELVAPAILLAECTSALRKRVFEGALRHEEAVALLGRALALPIRISHAPEQFILAMEIANLTRRAKAYDMQYVALAEVEGGEIVTLDGGIRQAAVERRIPVRYLR